MSFYIKETTDTLSAVVNRFMTKVLKVTMTPLYAPTNSTAVEDHVNLNCKGISGTLTNIGEIKKY